MNKKKSKIIVAILIVLFLILGSVAGIIIYINNGLKLTPEFLDGEVCDNGNIPCDSTTFIVDEGSYGIDTLNKLEDENIIKNANIVNYYSKIFGGYSFYAGRYTLPHEIDGMPITLDQLLQYLSDASNTNQDTKLVKLDEGDFARSFAYEIAQNLIIDECDGLSLEDSAQKIIDYWNNEDAVRGYMSDYPFLTEEMINSDAKILLEGYLFPDSYEFFEYTNLDQLTRKILDRTLNIYENHIDEFENSKLTTHQIFTLASIVQWESGDAEDSKMVAGAFLNRIDNPEFEGTGGRLQSTVTACYAFDLTKSECDSVGDSTQYTQQEDVYNTYTIYGFPPGPVCCPNEIAINAALNPNQEAGYYFFVANMCDGGTAFAKTYAEHNRNIDKYYLACSY